MAGFSVPQITFFYNGQVAAAGSVYVYQTGTTTPVTPYADAGLTTPLTNPINLDSNGQALFYVNGLVNLKLVAFNGLNGTGILIETVDPVFPINTGSSTAGIPWAVAGGTADAITATYSPAVTTLTDGLLLSFRATAANATTAPTFSPNGLVAFAITQKGGTALSAGSIAANLAEYILRYNLANTRWELLNPSVTSSTAVRGIYSNLKLTATSDTQAVVTADSIILKTAGSLVFEADAVNVTAAITASGANGLDTGTEAANTWYNVFVIYNGTTVASLLSLSATAPTLPSGYTYYARVGAVRNNASSNFYRSIQYNNDVQYIVGTNPTGMIQLASGTAGNIASAWAAIATGAFVPPTASRIRGVIFRGGAGTTNVIVAPNNSYGFQNSTTNPPFITKQMGTVDSGYMDMILESTNIYWASDSASNFLGVVGWQDNL